MVYDRMIRVLYLQMVSIDDGFRSAPKAAN